VVPRLYTYYISSFLFAVFGLKMLRDGWKMSAAEAQEEFEEVQEDLKNRERMAAEAGEDPEAAVNLVGGHSPTHSAARSFLWRFVSPIFLQVSATQYIV
jgi:putative Ca2+/H+ antiporter (TMEM165/GDT1 family)